MAEYMELTAADAKHVDDMNIVQKFLTTNRWPTLDQIIVGMSMRGFDVHVKTLRVPRKDTIRVNEATVYNLTYHADVWAKEISVTEGSPDTIEQRNVYYGDGNGDTPLAATVEACARAIRKVTTK